MNHDTLSNDTTMKRLRLIRDYVDLQNKLVTETVSRLDSSVTEYDFEESLPPTIIIEGTTWLTRAHGLGVLFSNPRTKVVVDAHVGFLDAPTAFDAWRLVQYCESLLGTDEDFQSWQTTLDELLHDRIIEAHSKHERHYVMGKKT